MAYSFNGTDQYFNYGDVAAFNNQRNSTMSVWLNAPDTSTDGPCFGERGPNVNNPTNNFQYIGQDNGGTGYRFLTIDAVNRAGKFVYSDAAVTTDTWEHIAGRYDPGANFTNLQEMYRDGVANSTATSLSTVPAWPSWTDPTFGLFIGAVSAATTPSTVSGYSETSVGHAAIWFNTILEDEEIAALAKGVSPLKIRTEALVFYAPLVGHSNDIIGGFTTTENGSPPQVADGFSQMGSLSFQQPMFGVTRGGGGPAPLGADRRVRLVRDLIANLNRKLSRNLINP